MTPEELHIHIRESVARYLKEQERYAGDFLLHIEQAPIEQVDLMSNYGEPEFDMTDWVEAVYEVKVKYGKGMKGRNTLYIGIPHPSPFLIPYAERYIPWQRPAWATVTPYKRLSDENIQAFEGFSRCFTEGDTKVFYYVINGMMEYHNSLNADMVQLLPVYERAKLIETTYLGNSPWQHWEITLKKQLPPREEEEDIPEEEWMR